VHQVSDLLHKVELCALSGDARQLLKDLIREVFAESGLALPRETGALRAKEAAAYLGIGKTRFHELLKEDPNLDAASIRVGRARVWPKEALDKWLKAKSSPLEVLHKTVAA
jgi:excisionase family DNA binding protein